MKQVQQQRLADEAALMAYAHARESGDSPVRALNRAILRWLACCGWADGREARARVREVLLRTSTMGPRDYEDWMIIALGDDVWGDGAPAAIHRLSLDCRTLDMQDIATVEEPEPAMALEPLPDAVREDAA